MTTRKGKRGECQWNGPFKWLITSSATKNRYILIHTQVTLTMTSHLACRSFCITSSRNIPWYMYVFKFIRPYKKENLFIMSKKSWFIMHISNKLNITYVSAQTFMWQLWPCAILSQTSWFRGKSKQLMQLSHGSKPLCTKPSCRVFLFSVLWPVKNIKSRPKKNSTLSSNRAAGWCVLHLNTDG